MIRIILPAHCRPFLVGSNSVPGGTATSCYGILLVCQSGVGTPGDMGNQLAVRLFLTPRDTIRQKNTLIRNGAVLYGLGYRARVNANKQK